MKAVFGSAAALGLVISLAIVAALAGRGGPVAHADRPRVAVVRGVGPALGRVRPAHALRGHDDDRGHRDGRRGTARARRGDVPVRVREPADAPVPQARRRDAGRDPERRARLLRAHRDQPARGPEAVLERRAPSTSCRPGSRSGILTIPLVATVSEDAMHSVPAALREAAYGIGARRRTVTTKVVFPAAVSGIVASLILGFARAVGRDDGRRHRRRSDGLGPADLQPAPTAARR